MKYQLRIIAGSLRGRRVTVDSDPGLRPMADRAREALFSILFDTVEDRVFYDVFAGSGAVGIEALSRGARSAVFVEKDPQAVTALIKHLEQFGVADKARVLRADAYRWADKWAVPTEPVIVFMGPPYQEFEKHGDAIQWLITTLQQQCPAESVLIVQSDKHFDSELLPSSGTEGGWDVRRYGRTQLAIWVKPRNQESEVRDQRSEIGEQRSEVSDQESEVSMP
jgi:16S rRNA (guanine(966)-N(2))-methyltransferase RsmD